MQCMEYEFQTFNKTLGSWFHQQDLKHLSVLDIASLQKQVKDVCKQFFNLDYQKIFVEMINDIVYIDLGFFVYSFDIYAGKYDGSTTC